MAMRVKCPKCGAQYNLDPQKLSPQGTKVRCSSCQHIFVVKRKAEGETSAPPPARPKEDDPIHGGAKAAPRSSSIVDDEPIAMSDTASDESPASAPKYREELHDLGKVPPAAASVPPKPAAPAPKPAPPPVSKPAAPAPAAPKAASPSQPVSDSGAKWRVKKQGLGLIYGPADLTTVQSWISNERINAKDAYSRDGSEWSGPEMFTEVAPLFGLQPAPNAVSPGASAVPAAPKPAAPVPAAVPEPDSVKLAPPAPRKSSTLGFELDTIDAPDTGVTPKGGSLALNATIGLGLIAAVLGGLFYFIVLPSDDLLDRFYGSPARAVVEPLVESLRPDYKSPEEKAQQDAAIKETLELQAQAQREAAEKRHYTEGYLPREEGPASGPILEALKAVLPDSEEGYKAAAAALEPLAGGESPSPEAAALHGFVLALSALSRNDESYATQALLAADNPAQIGNLPVPKRNTFIAGLLLSKRFTEAQKVAQEESSRNPSDPFVRYFYGIAKLSDPAGLDEYRKAVELEPGYVPPKVELAARLAAGGESASAEAEKLIREAVGLSPSHRKARALADSLGLKDLPPDPLVQTAPPKLTDREVQELFIATEQLVKDQKYPEATANLEKLISAYRAQLTPSMRGGTHYYRGEMYRIAGDKAAASAQYDTALLENPKETRAQKALEKFRKEAAGAPIPPAAPAAAHPAVPAAPAPAAPASAEPKAVPAEPKVAAPAPAEPAPKSEPAPVPEPPKPAEPAPARPPDVPPPADDLPPPPQ